MSEVKYKVCSRCGTQMAIEEGVICTSNPPMYRYKCPKCGAMEFDVERYPMPEIINDLTAQPVEYREREYWRKFRAEVAKDVLCAVLSAPGRWEDTTYEGVAAACVKQADELIRQLRGEKDA